MLRVSGKPKPSDRFSVFTVASGPPSWSSSVGNFTDILGQVQVVRATTGDSILDAKQKRNWKDVLSFLLLVLIPFVSAARVLGFARANATSKGGVPPALAQALGKAAGSAIMAFFLIAAHGRSALRESLTRKYLPILFASFFQGVFGYFFFFSLNFITPTTFTVTLQFAILFLVPMNSCLQRILPSSTQCATILMVFLLSLAQILGGGAGIAIHVGGIMMALLAGVSDQFADQIHEFVTQALAKQIENGEKLNLQLAMLNQMFQIPFLLVLCMASEQEFFSEESRAEWLNWRYFVACVLPVVLVNCMALHCISVFGAINVTLTNPIDLILVYLFEVFVTETEDFTINQLLLVGALATAVLQNSLIELEVLQSVQQARETWGEDLRDKIGAVESSVKGAHKRTLTARRSLQEHAQVARERAEVAEGRAVDAELKAAASEAALTEMKNELFANAVLGISIEMRLPQGAKEHRATNATANLPKHAAFKWQAELQCVQTDVDGAAHVPINIQNDLETRVDGAPDMPETSTFETSI